MFCLSTTAHLRAANASKVQAQSPTWAISAFLRLPPLQEGLPLTQPYPPAYFQPTPLPVCSQVGWHNRRGWGLALLRQSCNYHMHVQVTRHGLGYTSILWPATSISSAGVRFLSLAHVSSPLAPACTTACSTPAAAATGSTRWASTARCDLPWRTRGSVVPAWPGRHAWRAACATRR